MIRHRRLSGSPSFGTQAHKRQPNLSRTEKVTLYLAFKMLFEQNVSRATDAVVACRARGFFTRVIAEELHCFLAPNGFPTNNLTINLTL